MRNAFTAAAKRDGDWWTGWIEELPGSNCQERTREELLKPLRITLKEALESDREDTIRAAEYDYQEESVVM